MKKVIIMGAAGRDFHNFNTYFRDNPDYRVVAFTATQIPDIEGRKYPAALAGKLYPKGIPIEAEAELDKLIAANKVDDVHLAYSDLPPRCGEQGRPGPGRRGQLRPLGRRR
jgi:predicted GTPase